MTEKLRVLSLIWKSGAEIYRDPSDGRLALKNASQIPPAVLQAAEPIFGQIDKWYKSWESAVGPDVTIRKALHLFCGWQTNEKMSDWLCKDEESLSILYDWTVALTLNDWLDIYEDYRLYENEKSNELKARFYERAVSWSSKSKGGQ
ncbi:hypothetical protein NCCP2716_23340 [Sporosarcina sp. NCCP-2716]|uniref:hypothetical protein n=1 Tax=Sporosarcina sp. NCCP-2716 TaxID=2943679 RepID=UPI00203E8D92|nr:hypothetical protein [Sporosarcina sp. NCCP-2716]GKV69836.1 hypothetical protein NCCP2716_23340 [Sporosarcina sp. NCCP-2716]